MGPPRNKFTHHHLTRKHSLTSSYNYLFPLVDTAIAYKHIQICRCRAPDVFASCLKRLLIDLISNVIKPVFDSKHGCPTLFYFFCTVVVSNSRKPKSRVKSNVSQGTDGALRYPCICCVPKQQHLTAVRERCESWTCRYHFPCPCIANLKLSSHIIYK